MNLQKKHLLFDSSALISLGLTGSFPLLEKLKKDYRGVFAILVAVKQEIVDKWNKDVIKEKR